MSLVQRLIDQLAARGLEIKAGDRPGELLLGGPPAEKTPEIMRAVKAFKPQLLERYGRKESPQPAPAPVADPEGESRRPT
jgi:hypothetical protein